MTVTRSPAKRPRGYLGRHPAQLWATVARAWETGIAVSGNHARTHAPIIALAASLGWISTVSLSGKRFTGRWNVTAEGVMALNHIKSLTRRRIY